MKAVNFVKTTLGKLAIVGTMLSPLALAGCEGFDLGQTAGYAGADLGATALSTPYYGNSCFASGQDHYCDTGWSGWSDHGFGAATGAPVGGPVGAPGAACPADYGCEVEPACQPPPAPQAEECGVTVEYFAGTARLANARVIAGGLRIKYHISQASARRLGYAFAAARKNNPRPLMSLGFTPGDLAALKAHRPLSQQSVITISRRIGVSPRITRSIIADLERSYIRHSGRR